MKVNIDPGAGFCFGVKKAVEQAEAALAQNNSLYCLGEIVHNAEEVNRLRGRGLKTISPEEYAALNNKKVLIRAHGEPPETYDRARQNNIELIESTCPVVLKLQDRIKKAWAEVKPLGGAVVIAGKRNHPETIGLSGQTGNRAIIIENFRDLDRVDIEKPVRLFAQTTFDKMVYEEIKDRIKSKIIEAGADPGLLKSHNSICGQVSNRIPKLEAFCRLHDVIIFVSGKNSSNGKNLFEICKTANPSSYHISSAAELDMGWMANAKRVGISGATSTPMWLMESIANKIAE